jgi:hypothetical protein
MQLIDKSCAVPFCPKTPKMGKYLGLALNILAQGRKKVQFLIQIRCGKKWGFGTS